MKKLSLLHCGLGVVVFRNLVVTTSYRVRNFGATLCFQNFDFVVACATFVHYTFHKKIILVGEYRA